MEAIGLTSIFLEPFGAPKSVGSYSTRFSIVLPKDKSCITVAAFRYAVLKALSSKAPEVENIFWTLSRFLYSAGGNNWVFDKSILDLATSNKFKSSFCKTAAKISLGFCISILY